MATNLKKLTRLVNEIRTRMDDRRSLIRDGGPGSGNFGHSGRPGKIGGSSPEGSANTKESSEGEKQKSFIKHIQEYSYKAPKPGYVVSGANGEMRAKSNASRYVDTAWPKAVAREYGENSLSKHIDKNGKLSPERQAIHDSIIHDVFAGLVPTTGKKEVMMCGGGPASGKSHITDEAKGRLPERSTVIIDPDEFKNYLPGYAERTKTDKYAASYYHAESSVLAMRAYQFGAENGVDIIYDGTGDGSVREMMDKINTARKAGYEVNAKYVSVDLQDALERNRQRYEKGVEKYKAGKTPFLPRLVPDFFVKDCHKKVSDISVQIAKECDSFEVYDNNGPREIPPIKIAECTRGGSVTAVPGQEDKLQKYLDKGYMGFKVVNGKVQTQKEDGMSDDRMDERQKDAMFWFGYIKSLNEEKEPEESYVLLNEEQKAEYIKDLAYLKKQRKILPNIGYSIIE